MNIEVCLLCKNELLSLSKIFKKLKNELKNIKIKFFIMIGGSDDVSIEFYKK